MDILKNNNMKVPDTKRGNIHICFELKYSPGGAIANKKSKNMERQIQKGFQISKIEGVAEAIFGTGWVKCFS